MIMYICNASCKNIILTCRNVMFMLMIHVNCMMKKAYKITLAV